MRRLLLLATASAAAFFVPTTNALACPAGTVVPLGNGGTGTVYVVIEADVPSWIYIDSNDIFDLQRGNSGIGASPLSSPDPCAGETIADTVVY